MILDFILLVLFAGMPYYILFEKGEIVPKEKLFILSSVMLIVGMVLSYLIPHQISMPFEIVAFILSLFSFYKAEKTNNLYKLTYYILFFNAPMMMIFGTHEKILYGTALLLTLSGVYLMGRYYERSYGSANYQSVSGITLVTPYAGLILTIYLTALALYPPFPNAILFLNGILNGTIDTMWYLIVVVIFFGNFLIAVRVMAKTVFGSPNENIHYIDVSRKERLIHLGIVILLLVLSIIGLQEVL